MMKYNGQEIISRTQSARLMGLTIEVFSQRLAAGVHLETPVPKRVTLINGKHYFNKADILAFKERVRLVSNPDPAHVDGINRATAAVIMGISDTAFGQRKQRGDFRGIPMPIWYKSKGKAGYYRKSEVVAFMERLAFENPADETTEDRIRMAELRRGLK